MGSKTVAISDEIHILLVKTQTEIFEKNRTTVRIADLANSAVEHGIEKVREKYGISKPVEMSTQDSGKSGTKIIEECVGNNTKI